MVRVRVLKIKNGYIETAGTLPRVSAGKKRSVRICCSDGSDIVPETFAMPYRDILDDEGKLISEVRGFRARLPLKDGASYRFVLDKEKASGRTVCSDQELQFGDHSQLQNIDGSYCDSGEFIVRCIDNEIRVSRASWSLRLACRRRLERTLRDEGKEQLIPLRRKAERTRKKGSPVVIIADRVNRAGDNGEALFRYLMANGYDAVYDIYFAVIKESPDYERMRRYGKVLDFGSDDYKEKFLIADRIITAGFDKWFGNAFDEDYKYMADLYLFSHCFLQHGVIMNDLSQTLNYTVRGFDKFCTTAEGEYRSILDGNYAYHDDEVVLTGLARYDLLEDEAEKLIVFLPTWRLGLAGEIDREHGARFYSDLIPGSEYCRFYNRLINDERLLASMKEHGYRGEFYLHPSFIENIADFSGNDVIEVRSGADYSSLFRRAAVMVTDYSSVNVDFAYLRKPVVYSQFDREEFFREHLAGHGYFDYERDGFGPVCRTEEETAAELISLMKTGCRAQKKYTERAERFFRYSDRNNCRRIAEAIFGNADGRDDLTAYRPL